MFEKVVHKTNLRKMFLFPEELNLHRLFDKRGNVKQEFFFISNVVKLLRISTLFNIMRKSN